jgi:outer membrane protein TolC
MAHRAQPLIAALLVASLGSPGFAQTPRILTLDDALGLAERSSEQLAIAQAGVDRASSAEMRAKADLMPQVNFSGSYDRTFKSEFADVFSSGPSCTPLTVNPSAALDARVSEIERALQDCPPSFFGSSSSSSSSSSDSSLPFGQANTYRLNFQVVQSLWTAGRIPAQRSQARYNRQNADITLNSTKAQVYLDVSQAYYDAALSDRLLAIAEATLAQADSRSNSDTRPASRCALVTFTVLSACASVASAIASSRSLSAAS